MTELLLEPLATARANLRAETLLELTWRRYRRNRLALVALAVLVTLIALAVLAPLSPYDPRDQNPAQRFSAPSAAHWLGTDGLGRDVLTRLLYGGQVSLAVGLLSTALTLGIGALVGALAGYFGGWVDNLLMRLTDVFLSFPTAFIFILLTSLLREYPALQLTNSVAVVIIAIAALSWMYTARIVRSQFLALRERDFVAASRALGASDWRLILQHLLPNCLPVILVNGSLQMAFAIITESSLTYLGFGVQEPTASWGNILEEAQRNVYRAPWLAVFPGVMIFLTAMSVNFIGDGIRDAMDPYTVRTQS
jgi:peptide/nickel transport system permease protein